MSKYKVIITGVNTQDLKTLTQEEMRELFKNIKTDESARAKLIEGNYKLVLSILKYYAQKTDNMDDLFQIGVIGLIKAIDNFDLKYEVRFSTYAVPMIQGEVRRYLRDNSAIRVPRSLKDCAYKVLKCKDVLVQQLGREATITEIANYLEIDEIDVIIAMDSSKSPVSMYEPIYNDGGDVIYLLDQIENKKTLYDNDMYLSLDYALNKIDKRESNIIWERYINGKTQLEIAEEIGISQAQISRLEKNAMKSVKAYIK